MNSAALYRRDKPTQSSDREAREGLRQCIAAGRRSLADHRKEDAHHARNRRSNSLARAGGLQARRLRQIQPPEDALRPVHGIGRDSDLPRHRRQQSAEPAAATVEAHWAAAAAYIQLHGTEGKWGSYVVEVPGAGALNPEKHMYEEVYLVVEGRGSTEVWLEGDNKRHVFEWQKGSLFSIPVNAMHRIVNASSSPALLLGGTTAPNLMNLINNTDAIFNCPYPVPRPLLRRRRFLQIQGRHRARSGARACHAANQFHSRHRQLRSAARQPALARLAPGRAVHDRQHILSVDRPARERPLFQGARAYVRRGADLHQGQRLHLYVAGKSRPDAVERRQGGPGQARRLRAGRHGVGGARRRALVSPAFRRLERSVPPHRLVRAAQSRTRAGPARRKAHRLHRDGYSRGRHRDPLLHGGSVPAAGIRGDA